LDASRQLKLPFGGAWVEMLGPFDAVPVELREACACTLLNGFSFAVSTFRGIVAASSGA